VAPAAEIARIARLVALDVVQLHGDPSAEDVRAARDEGVARVWAVVRVAGRELPPSYWALAPVADGIVLDARVPGRLGGTGVALDWAALAAALGRGRATRLVLAGGLTPENVAEAVATLRPDVVDVSSGVEMSVGVKDHARMRSFVDAVRGAVA
jgi:phosphoribosylanthranilate isomerase